LFDLYITSYRFLNDKSRKSSVHIVNCGLEYL
jgi:hypothetical protein